MLGTEPIYKVFPRSTSWNAANASGIVSEFDFQILELLTDNYALQQNVIDQVSTVAGIILNITPGDPQMIVNNLSMNMQELAGREQLLLLNYEQILRKVNASSSKKPEQ